MTNDQFLRKREYWLQRVDFLNWYRYYHIIKDILNIGPQAVLEIGCGNGIVKDCIKDHVGKYVVVDINPNLGPDFIADVRNFIPDLEGKFNAIIIADVLEHIPFSDLPNVLKNLSAYLCPKGKILITIPHRATYFLLMGPNYKPFVIRVPTGFCSLGSFIRRFIKRKIWIDPDHQWEIGDGKHSVSLVEKNLLTHKDLKIIKRQKLLYVDYWLLQLQ